MSFVIRKATASVVALARGPGKPSASAQARIVIAIGVFDMIWSRFEQSFYLSVLSLPAEIISQDAPSALSRMETFVVPP
jgi:hypothetical protein